jgi:hypothetical protein
VKEENMAERVYRLEYDTEIGKLEEKVNQSINEGWNIVVSGPVVAEWGGNMVIVQATVKQKQQMFVPVKLPGKGGKSA